MNLNEFMTKHFNALQLTPHFYHQWPIAIHIELGQDCYPIEDNNQINRVCFHEIYNQISEIIPRIFNISDDILVVVNSYPLGTKNTVFPNFFKRYVKNQKLKYSLHLQNIHWQFDEDLMVVQQMSLFCKVSDLKLEYLLKTLIHEDFCSLQPRLRRKYSIYAPDVFLINVQTNCIFHLYDDRGCEIINADMQLTT